MLTKTIVEGHIRRGRSRADHKTEIMKDLYRRKYKDLKELNYNKETSRTVTNQFKD